MTFHRHGFVLRHPLFAGVLAAVAILAPASVAQNGVTPGEFIVEPPTLICAGFEWKVAGDANRNATVNVQYRRRGGTEWRAALPLLRILDERVYHRGNNIDYRVPNMFAGSVLDLEPATEYEFRLAMTDPDGVVGDAIREVTLRTRAEPQAPGSGRVFHVYPPGYQGRKQEPNLPSLKAAFWGPGGGDWNMAYEPVVGPGDTILLHAGTYKSDRYNYRDPLGLQFHGTYVIATSGTPEQPIAIKAAGDGEVILDGAGNHRLFDVMAANHLHFEGLTLRNTEIAIFAGMKKLMGASGLTVKHCRFEDVGIGVITEHASSKNFYIADNVFLGRHDRTQLHGWSGEWLERGPPALIDSYLAVKVYGQGHVICHNYAAYFHDGFTISTYGVPEPSPELKCVAIDIYNNDVHLVSDNFVEADGGAHNIRILRNRGFNAAGQALSAQPVYGGPAYFVRNIVYHVPRGGALKFNVGPSGMLVYHNTFVAEVTRSSPFSNAHLRNNLILGTGTPRRPVLDIRTYTAHTSLDYNGYRPNPGEHAPFEYGAPAPAESPLFTLKPDAAKEYRTLGALAAATGHERHGRLVDYDVFRKVTAPDPTRAEAVYHAREFDFRLREGTAAVDAGVVLPNINDRFTGRAPDLGAYELGQPPVVYGPRPR